MFEMFQLPFMVQAFVAAIITGALLSYLGVHVVGRGIVFVDLALGQISSLGVAFAAFIGTGLDRFGHFQNSTRRFGYPGSIVWKYFVCKLEPDIITRNCFRRHRPGTTYFLQ